MVERYFVIPSPIKKYVQPSNRFYIVFTTMFTAYLKDF